METDVCSPTAAHPASKIAAERLPQDIDLTWVILRLPFVYGEGDCHLASIPALAPRLGLHPAHTYAVAHHHDIAAAVRLSVTGVMDGRVVNVTDDAPVTVFEMARLAGQPIEGSAEPLTNPWSGRMDSTLIRELGFLQRADHPRRSTRRRSLTFGCRVDRPIEQVLIRPKPHRCAGHGSRIPVGYSRRH